MEKCEIKSQNQDLAGTFKGSVFSSVKKHQINKNDKPIIKRQKFTDNEPIFFPADVYANAVNVQNIAAIMA